MKEQIDRLSSCICFPYIWLNFFIEWSSAWTGRRPRSCYGVTCPFRTIALNDFNVCVDHNAIGEDPSPFIQATACDSCWILTIFTAHVSTICTQSIRDEPAVKKRMVMHVENGANISRFSTAWPLVNCFGIIWISVLLTNIWILTIHYAVYSCSTPETNVWYCCKVRCGIWNRVDDAQNFENLSFSKPKRRMSMGKGKCPWWP